MASRKQYLALSARDPRYTRSTGGNMAAMATDHEFGVCSQRLRP
jgi:hypothetical protein